MKRKLSILTIFLSLFIFIFQQPLLKNKAIINTVFADDEVPPDSPPNDTPYSPPEDTPFTITNKSNYDVTEYKTYNNRGFEQEEFKDKFHHTPLIKVPKEYGSFPAEEKGGDLEKVYREIRQELALTGYEAYCMAKNVPIEPQYSDRLIKRFLELFPDGVNRITTTTDTLNTDRGKYPIWRDVSGKQFLMTSLEEYMGFKDVYEDDPALSELKTAPINSLLSQEQACVQGWRSLAAQRRACNRLKKQNDCALTKRKIPGTGYEAHDVMGLTGSLDGGWATGIDKDTIERATVGCHYLFSTENELNKKEKDLKRSIINVPTYMDRGYRIGFLITVIETKMPEEECHAPTHHADILFNFFTPKTECAPKDEVLVSAFKLPDIGTNKGPDGLYGHENWDDPLDLTRMSLTTKKQQDIHNGGRSGKRSSILAGAKNAAKTVSRDSEIFCYKYIGEELDATNTCLAPVPRALVDIVNGTAKKNICGVQGEAVKIISDIAGVRVKSPMDTYGKEFKPANGGIVLQNILFGSVYNSNGLSPGYSDVDLTTIWDINEETWKPKVSRTLAHFYLVYPMGYELKDIEKAIKGAFFSTEQLSSMKDDNTINKSFEMTGQTQSLNNPGVHWTFEDEEKTKAGDCGYKENEFGVIDKSQPIPCLEHPSIKIDGGDGQVNILGGKLSWWLRKIQSALNSKSSLAYNYFESCKTMEEFLLGKCKGSSNYDDYDNLDKDVENICDVAEAYNIDCKFLRAIYAIESGSGTVIDDAEVYPGTTKYCCNTDQYCGPMSVSSFHTPDIAAGDDLHTCKEEENGMDAFILASRWLLIKKWCTSNINECLPDPNYAHWKEKYIEQEGNPSITTRKEVEEFVYGWYGSLGPADPRDGWPEGATYQDAVMACMGIPGAIGDWSAWLNPPGGVGGGFKCPVND